MAKYICWACGAAEQTDMHCTLEIGVGEPELCPLSGDDAEWEKQAAKAAESEVKDG